jgi:arginase
VEDGGDIGPFHSAEDSEHPTCRNVAGVVDMMRRTESAVAGAGNGLTLVLGGDCSLVSGVLAGARKRVGGPVALVFLDAHGDLNTPQTSPSGRICGMALAVALGHGHKDLVSASSHTPLVDPARTALLGPREIDPGERKLMEILGLALEATDVIRSGPEAAADLALRVAGDLPIVVHLDVDIIDGHEMATNLPAALGGGLPRTDVATLLGKLLRARRVVALTVSGFEKDGDADGSHARALVEILAGAIQKSA